MKCVECSELHYEAVFFYSENSSVQIHGDWVGINFIFKERDVRVVHIKNRLGEILTPSSSDRNIISDACIIAFEQFTGRFFEGFVS